MSISSLIDAEQQKKQITKSEPIITPPSSQPITPKEALNVMPFSGLSLPSARMSYQMSNDTLPFPRLTSNGLPSPPGNAFLNGFPLPSVNQAVGDVDRSTPPRNSPPPLVTSNKRKWDSTEETRISKIRRSIGEILIQGSGTTDHYQKQQMIKAEPQSSPIFSPQHVTSDSFQMTTITCLHASVAQKSYGSEKRFLCPPPVVTIEQPNASFHGKPDLLMSVICETGDRPMEIKAMLDENMKGTFKYLHVSGTAKAKQFSLKLKVCNKNHSIPYAIFDSAPVTIISKPSKKTAKARNVSSCILSGAPISLFNRINSQTVRTKYMGIENGNLCAKNSSWSPFIITVLSSSTPAILPPSPSKFKTNSTQSLSTNPNSAPITYGSEIIITDPETNISSERLIIRKVEKGRIAQGACGPVSQMQKIALQRVGTTGQNSYYLSAAGQITIDSPQSQQDQCTVSGASPYLGYQPSRVVHMQTLDSSKSMDHFNDVVISSIVEEVEDHLCWTIVGISKFEYTYFESFPSSVPFSGPSTPESSPSPPVQMRPQTNYPITPFPTLTSTPIYRQATNSIETTVGNFYYDTSSYQASSQPQPQQPMEVWLGQHGPLTTRVMRRPGMQTPTIQQQVVNGALVNDTGLVIDLPKIEELLRSSVKIRTTDREYIELPLLFVRMDGVCYHSKRSIVVEKLESDINNGEILSSSSTPWRIRVV
jgi:hypothetical protein